jgi:transcriptional regulator
VYIPQHFAMQIADAKAMLACVRAADLITAGPDGLIATLLPLLYLPDSADPDGFGVLQGHVARNNPQLAAAGETQADSLVIVRGSDGYISPRFYASKAEDGRVVPTWNYAMLHVYGELVIHDDPEWLLDLVTRLTDHHEAGAATPWHVDDAPGPFIAGQLRAIVGLELRISRIEAKNKMSQNRSDADRIGVIEGLRTVDPGDPVAAAVAAALHTDGAGRQ